MLMYEPCPFCKSTNTALEIKTSKGEKGITKFTFYVRCRDCHARGSTFKCEGKIDRAVKKKAEDAWNRQHTSE
jgi:hypothetical protein